jgi:hypothetical protein
VLLLAVIPAKAGIQFLLILKLGPGLRRGDAADIDKTKALRGRRKA